MGLIRIVCVDDIRMKGCSAKISCSLSNFIQFSIRIIFPKCKNNRPRKISQQLPFGEYI